MKADRFSPETFSIEPEMVPFVTVPDSTATISEAGGNNLDYVVALVVGVVPSDDTDHPFSILYERYARVPFFCESYAEVGSVFGKEVRVHSIFHAVALKG